MLEPINQNAEEIIHRLTHYHPVTRLPNRILFHDLLQQEIASASRRKESVSIFLIDLFQLKELTDTFGYHFSDMVLQKAGDRLTELFSQSNAVACFPENNFAVMAPMTGIKGATITAGQIVKLFEPPLVIEEIPVALTVKVGIAIFPDHEASAGPLMQGAAAAMHAATNTEDDYILYSPTENKEAVYHMKLMGELPNAISSGQLVMHYQPKVDLATGSMSSAEALIRWEHPEHGFLLPGAFIPSAERNRLLQPITAWGIETTVRQIKEWSRKSILISTNLSAQDIQRRSLIDQIEKTIRRVGIPPHLLEFEITETAIVTNYEMAREVLFALSNMGTSISIDDFGAGYTSLKMLKNLPVQGIKLDRSLIQDLISDRNARFTVLALIDLAHHLDLTVTAEGIENKDIHELLIIGGCDLGQGSYFGLPMSAAEMTPMLGSRLVTSTSF
jgi:diguanylate cyclase (GGDEF)-like protein